jgi:hypothetical protein
VELERGSTRSHPVENSLWKRLRTCRKTDYRMNELMNECIVVKNTGFTHDCVECYRFAAVYSSLGRNFALLRSKPPVGPTPFCSVGTEDSPLGKAAGS